MYGDFLEVALGSITGVTIGILVSLWIFFYIGLSIISVFTFNPHKSEEENQKALQGVVEISVTVLLLLATILPPIKSPDYPIFVTMVAICWGVLMSMWMIRLIDRFANALSKWVDKKIIPSLNKRFGFIYEHKQRYARFVVKSRRNEPNRSGWVYLETKKNLYIKSDQSERTYRIKKDNVGKPNYPVLSLELSNAPQV
jgi:hypothetical protein